jgi:hypothetical protein
MPDFGGCAGAYGLHPIFYERGHQQSARRVSPEAGEAYRSELRIVQQRLDSFWEARAAALDSPQDAPHAARFEQAVKTQLAEAVICLAKNGELAYPAAVSAPAPDPTANAADWQRARALEAAGEFSLAAAAYSQIAEREVNADLAGRALQAEIRCTQHSASNAVVPLLIKSQRGRFAAARDMQVRLISADELLLAIHLVPAGNPGRLRAAQRLHELAANYQVNMPAAQRLFLMEELRSLKLDPGVADFPTYEAEKLAARYLQGGRVHAGDAVLRLSEVPEISKLTSRDGRTIALYDDQTVGAVMFDALKEAMDSLKPASDMSLRFARHHARRRRAYAWLADLAGRKGTRRVARNRETAEGFLRLDRLPGDRHSR